MKMKKLTPATLAPVKRENAATVSRDGNAIATSWNRSGGLNDIQDPFAGDNAE